MDKARGKVEERGERVERRKYEGERTNRRTETI